MYIKLLTRMAKGIFGGMTDYNHQSFDDILLDIENEKNNTSDYIQLIRSHVDEAEASGYWTNKVPADFKLEVTYALTHYTTAEAEFADILKELKVEVKENHVRRLERIAEVADKINRSIGKMWHNEYHNKEYGIADFYVVERIYCDTRDMAVNLLDTANIAERLKDFVGKQSQPAPNKKFKLELSHKIGLISIIVALFVLLFGNNIVGRLRDQDKTVKPSLLADSVKKHQEINNNKRFNQTNNNNGDVNNEVVMGDKNVFADTALSSLVSGLKDEIKALRKELKREIITAKPTATASGNPTSIAVPFSYQYAVNPAPGKLKDTMYFEPSSLFYLALRNDSVWSVDAFRNALTTITFNFGTERKFGEFTKDYANQIKSITITEVNTVKNEMIRYGFVTQKGEYLLTTQSGKNIIERFNRIAQSGN